MALTASEVEKVALLARLQLTASELDSMTVELSQVVEYVDLLSEVDTTDVVPMVHAVELCNVTKDDQSSESLPRQEALANAPNHNDQGYLVPAVMGD